MTLQRAWIPSPNYSSRGGTRTRLVVLHTAEGALTYQSLGSYFANPSSQVSSHVGIDDQPAIGEYVKRDQKAWAQANANPYSVCAELCAFAAWDAAEWSRHPTMLANTAQWVAEECAAFGIPVVRLSAAQAQGGASGVCDHYALGAAGGGHWDCGPAFEAPGGPLDQIIAVAAGGAGPTPQPPPSPKEVPVITQTVKYNGDQVHFFQVDNGALWHKWSGDQGSSWHNEVLISKSGAPVSGVTLKDSVSASVVDDTCYVTTEDDAGQPWVCRQGKATHGKWDSRKSA